MFSIALVLALVPLQKFLIDFNIFQMEMPFAKWKQPCPLKDAILSLGIHYFTRLTMRENVLPMLSVTISTDASLPRFCPTLKAISSRDWMTWNGPDKASLWKRMENFETLGVTCTVL